MQKLQLWTAGSISKELRGLNVKNWAELQLLLNCSGPRVDFKEAGGLFSKTASRNSILESGPLDRDLRARV